ncbi:MAG: glucuronate isomerase [Cyclobacteriaceae bacterium]
MKEFLTKDFLLETDVAKSLYHDHAAKMPIIDFHNHLSPKDIAEDRVYANATEAWLEGDHYKWRAMRANGVDESYTTGDRSAEEKFEKWAETVPFTLRNPLYHWTHLELRRYFGIESLLSEQTSKAIFEEVSSKLKTPEYSCRGLLEKMKVEVVCTTDDPTDDLRYHIRIKDESLDIKALPTFRPDKLYDISSVKSYQKYIEKLSAVSDIEIKTFDSFILAIEKRMDFFHEVGCRLSDHGLDYFGQLDYSPERLKSIFEDLLGGNEQSEEGLRVFRHGMMVELSKRYHTRGWTQQFHLGVIRNNNDRLMRELGPDTGFDSMGDFQHVLGLKHFLNQLDQEGKLTKTIVYNLNPKDNEAIATMLFNFNDGSAAGKIQFGSGWWFLDQKDGMEKQLNTLSNMGLLRRFVGMLTDSRSFLSMTRHEYFRRILCNLLGNDVEKGELPHDMKLLGSMVEDICYNNAKRYFDF